MNNPNLLSAVSLRRAVSLLSHATGFYVRSGVLNAVDIDADGDKLRVSSSGRTCRIALTLDAPAPTGSIQVQTRGLATALGALSGGVVVTVGKRLEVDDGMAALSLSGMETDRAPWDVAPTAEHVVDGPALTLALSRVVHAIAPDNNRYGLNGLCLDIEGGRSRFVATDGNRLSMVAVDGDITAKRLLPRPVVETLIRLAPVGPVRFAVGDNGMRITGEGFEIVTRGYDVEFPAYRQVLPSSFAHDVIVDRDALAKAVRAVEKMARDTSSQARWALADGAIRLTSEHPDFGTATAMVPAGITGSPPSVGFNCLFVLDVLRALPPGPVSISLGQPLGPTMWRSLTTPDASHIVMPLRLV